MTFKFMRGDVVRSIKDGITGIVVGYYDSIGSVPMYDINVIKCVDKQEYPGECTSVHIDECELVKLDVDETRNYRTKNNYDASYVKAFEDKFKFNHNDRVTHTVSDTKGIVIGRAIFSNECLYYNISTGKFDKDNKPVVIHISENMLELDHANVKKNVQEKTKPVKTGGPRMKRPSETY